MLRCAPLLAVLLPVGCASTEPVAVPIEEAVYRRAELDRSALLEAEISRLREDLRQAEEVLVMAESGLRGSHSRADAVSLLAEARIDVERASGETPWRTEAIAEAHVKLTEADAQIEGGNFGAALFFVYRASRIAEQLQREAATLRGRQGMFFIRARLANLRAGPSADQSVLGVLREGTPVFAEKELEPWVLVRVNDGSVGWVHASLLRAK